MQREDEGGAGGGVPGWKDHGRAGGGRGSRVGLVRRSLGFLVLARLTVALLLSQYMGPPSLVPTQMVYDFVGILIFWRLSCSLSCLPLAWSSLKRDSPPGGPSHCVLELCPTTEKRE